MRWTEPNGSGASMVAPYTKPLRDPLPGRADCFLGCPDGTYSPVGIFEAHACACMSTILKLKLISSPASQAYLKRDTARTVKRSAIGAPGTSQNRPDASELKWTHDSA